MLATILIYIIMTLSIIGLTLIIENLWLYFLHAKNSPKNDLIIHLEQQTAKIQLFEISEVLKWKGENRINKIYITNVNIPHDEYLSLKNEFQNNKFVFIENMEIKNWIP